MIRNRLSLLQLFALLMFVISLSLMVIAWILHAEIKLLAEYEEYTENPWLLWLRNGFIFISVWMIIAAIGLLARKKWAVTVFIVLFWLFGIAGIGLIVLLFYNTPVMDYSELLLLAGFSALTCAALLAGILYLDNAYVLETIDTEGTSAEAHLPDVLDQ